MKIKPRQVAAHCAQCNSQERGRSQQLGNKNCERLTQDDHELRQSELAEMTPLKVAAHCAQRNSQERGRAQQLGNDNCEIFTEDEAV